MKSKSLLLVIAIFSAAVVVQADSAAIAPQFFGPGQGIGCTVIEEGAAATTFEGGFVLSCEPSAKEYPGIALKPTAAPWDFGAFGRVEAVVSNACEVPFGLAFRLDNPTHWEHNNTEQVYLKPREQRTLKVIFGYQYGFKPGYKLDASNVSQMKVFFTGKNGKASRKAVITELRAAGAAGEKPPVSPNNVVTVPPKGLLIPFRGGDEKNFNEWVGAQARFRANGSIAIAFSEKKGCAVRFKPAAGTWNLGEWLRLEAVVSNTCKRALSPVVKIDSKGGAIATEGDVEIPPWTRKKLTLDFLPALPWDAGAPKDTTGTKFESHRVTGLIFSVKDNQPGDSYDVLGVRTVKLTATVPSWVGMRPPVAGKWKKTFSDEFDGKELDRKTWVTKWPNYWDKRTHFSDANAFLRDGKLVLRYEKKRGRHNDDPNGKETDYQCGYASTFGTFTQKYGYFEARMKLPRAPGLWPAFWTMPDRGGKGPHWTRSDTWNGGMEFDIMEHLTAWGPNRFNMAFHWDGYDKGHKSTGTSGGYLAPDAGGFIIVGMLWLPGEVVYYGNGSVIGRWKDPRIATVPMYFIFYMVSGGWANVPLDDSVLPDEFQVDWFRAWQRDDLVQ